MSCSDAKKHAVVEMSFPPDFCIGPYKVVRLLGRSGIGVVYEVEHVRLGVRYALKAFMLEGKNADFLKKRFLSPFGRHWRTLFAALLAEKPAERSMPRFALPACPSRCGRIWGIAALAFLLGALAVFVATRDWTHKDAAPTWTEAEALFDIPDSVK